MAVQRGRSERRGESYSAPYVEPLSETRTKPEDFFNILLVIRSPLHMAGKAGSFTTSRLAIPYPNKRRFTNDEERLFPNRNILRPPDDLNSLEHWIL